MKRRTSIITALALSALFTGAMAVTEAGATLQTISDGNSTATVNPGSQAGMNSWTVDGTNQLFQQWFWYRVGSSTGQSSIDTLSLSSANNTGNGLVLNYTGTGFTLSVNYSLNGGSAGSGTADIGELINIHNTSTSSLDFHFFQYSDFDLNGSFAGDTATHVNANTIDQFKPGINLAETVATPAPSHWQIGTFPSILDSLNSGSAYTLSDSGSVVNGDATWAFEWDKNISAGGSLLISKDKHIGPVPEPSTLLLLGSGLTSLGFFARKIKRG